MTNPSVQHEQANASGPHLKLADPAPLAFNHLRYGWALRDSGLIAQMRDAELRVLFYAYLMANADGECDLPAEWLGNRVRLSERSVRDQIKSLIGRKVFADAGPGSVDPRVRRIRLVLPAEPPIRHASAEPTPEPECTDTGTPVHRSLHGLAGKECVKEGEKEIRRHGATARTAGDEVTLFDEPVYDRAAAAVLTVWGRLPWKLAHGLVTQYRPTRRQMLHILANGFAWRRAAAAKQAPPLRDFVGFVRGSLRDGNVLLDGRVLEMRDKRRRHRRRIEVATQRSDKRADELAERDALQRQREADDALLAATSRDAIERATRQALAAMPEAVRRMNEGKTLSHPGLRAAVLAVLRKEESP